MAAIYRKRWDIELRLRDVETTHGMEQMTVKHPETAQKTLEMTTIACNLIKATCHGAATETGEDHRMLSFKGTGHAGG